MINRNLAPKLRQMLKYFPILSINGPRQSGKSTLLKNTFAELPYITLENPDDLNLALTDPVGFLANFPKGAILDEVQNAPQLFSYLQHIVDTNSKIKFILCGSQNFLLNHQISQTLAGRVGVLTLLPFSLKEIVSIKNNNFESRAFTGFYPRIYDKKIPPILYYPSYLQTYVQRDVLQLLKVTEVSVFTKFIYLLAGRVGQLLNMSSLANDVGVAVNTIKAWISVLEASYIIYLLKPHHNNFNKRLIQSPKIYFYDTGLLCYLLGIQNVAQVKTHFAKGHIFENLVIIDILKNEYNNAQLPALHFWRDKNGNEVDLIIEKANKINAYEIKSSSTKSIHFFDSLDYYKNLAAEQKVNTYVIYTGNESIKLKNGNFIGWKELTKGIA